MSPQRRTPRRPREVTRKTLADASRVLDAVGEGAATAAIEAAIRGCRNAPAVGGVPSPTHLDLEVSHSVLDELRNAARAYLANDEPRKASKQGASRPTHKPKASRRR